MKRKWDQLIEESKTNNWRQRLRTTDSVTEMLLLLYEDAQLGGEGLTSWGISRSIGTTVSPKFPSCKRKGLIKVVSGAGHHYSPYRYAITSRGITSLRRRHPELVGEPTPPTPPTPPDPVISRNIRCLMALRDNGGWMTYKEVSDAAGVEASGLSWLERDRKVLQNRSAKPYRYKITKRGISSLPNKIGMTELRTSSINNECLLILRENGGWMDSGTIAKAVGGKATGMSGLAAAGRVYEDKKKGRRCLYKITDAGKAHLLEDPKLGIKSPESELVKLAKKAPQPILMKVLHILYERNEPLTEEEIQIASGRNSNAVLIDLRRRGLVNHFDMKDKGLHPDLWRINRAGCEFIGKDPIGDRKDVPEVVVESESAPKDAMDSVIEALCVIEKSMARHVSEVTQALVAIEEKMMEAFELCQNAKAEAKEEAQKDAKAAIKEVLEGLLE